MRLDEYESRVNRGRFSFRSKRLDGVVQAIARFRGDPTEPRLRQVEEAVDAWRRHDPREYADRGRPVEGELEAAIRLAGRKWWGEGRIRLADRPSHPRYEPHVWNSGWVLWSTNCYAYACNDPLNHALMEKPQPGLLARPKATADKDIDHSSIRHAVMLDDQTRNRMRLQRLIPLVRLREDVEGGRPVDVANVPGHYLLALAVAPGNDYHWYRQDDTGLWSHKPGHRPATNLNASGRPIADPRDCNLGKYAFTCFYYAPKGGVRTASLGDRPARDWMKEPGPRPPVPPRRRLP